MRSRRHNHGSTFILVLAMLSILVLIAAAFSYTSRLEALASVNYSQSLQARAAATSGLPSALALVQEATSVTSTLQGWSRASAVQYSATRKTQSRLGAQALRASTQSNAGTAGTQASLTINDLCARVNLNAISNEKTLERFLSALASPSLSQGVMDSNTASHAKAVFSLRRTEPGTTTSLQPDLRKPAKPGTRRIESLQDLRRTNARYTELFTDAQLRLLGNYLTVFSQSPEVFNRKDGTSLPKLSLHKISANELYERLQAAFAEKDPRLLLQFAANAADQADTDDVPTRLKDPNHPEIWNTILGFEQTPLITEVFTNASASGQSQPGWFVEIYNPWEKPLTLSNWRLVVGGAGNEAPGAQGSFQLNLVLPAGGYVLITDNYDHPATDSATGTGALLAIFGTKGDQNLHKVIEQPGMTIPSCNSYLTLLDGSGNLIDVFSYTAAVAPNSKMSYQRNDPRLRSFGTAEATPFAKPPQGVYTGTPQAEAAMLSVWKGANNGGFASPVDLLRVSSAYVGLRASDNKSMFDVHPWQTPSIEHFDQDNATNFDAYVSDLFTAVSTEDEQTTSSEESLATEPSSNPTPSARYFSQGVSFPQGGMPSQQALLAARQALNAPSQSPLGLKRSQSKPGASRLGQPNSRTLSAQPGSAASLAQSAQSFQVQAEDFSTTSSASTSGTQKLLYAFGRLNLNTCPKVALYSLDGEAQGTDLITPDFVERFEQYRLKRLSQKQTPFTNLSDLLVEFFPHPSEKQLQAFAKLTEQITVSSSSFEVIAENRLPAEEKPDAKRQPTLSRVRWAVALDTAPYSLVNYSMQP